MTAPGREACCSVTPRLRVVGMFFFEDNNYVLVDGNPIGARLHKVAKDKSILLMGCDQCC
jgi:hypothetical protein